ncbi:hypothetical protein [Vreelandella titanicae]
MNEKLAWTLFAITVFGSIAFGIWFGMQVWDECREAGRSVLYCMRMVTR